jgi:hypothetical protein
MAHRSPMEIPGDLRARLEAARLALLALFRALDRMNLSPVEIPQGCYGNSLKQMPITQKLCGRWTNLTAVWIAAPCSAIRSLHWTSCRRRAPSFGNGYLPVLMRPCNNWKAASSGT